MGYLISIEDETLSSEEARILAGSYSGLGFYEQSTSFKYFFNELPRIDGPDHWTDSRLNQNSDKFDKAIWLKKVKKLTKARNYIENNDFFKIIEH
jgi:hypothetical protein